MFSGNAAQQLFGFDPGQFSCPLENNERALAAMAQLAIAWCAKHPMVASVITGASRPEQVVENMKAVDVIPQITTAVREEIEAAVS